MALNVGINSYISRSDANSYFADNLQNPAWSALTDIVKDQALITASGQLSLFVDDSCKLPLTAPIPTPLNNASAELGIYLAQNPSAVTASNTGSNTKRVKAGSAEVEFFKPQSGARFPSNVMAILAAGGCISKQAGIGVSGVGGAFSSGTDSKSSFDNDDSYGKTEGYS